MSLCLEKIKLIAFDWDGTLVNSLNEVIIAFQKTCEFYTIPVPDKNTIRKNIGLGHDDIWNRLSQSIGSSFKIPDRGEFWKQFYNNYGSGNVDIFPGIEDALHTLIDNGFGLAVVTNKPSLPFLSEIDDLKLRTCFLDCLCADQYIEKPDPMMLRVLSARQDLSKDQILMVGDTTFDIDAANAFGCQSVAVTCGNMNEEELLLSKPTVVFKDVQELADRVKSTHPLGEELEVAY